MLSTGNGTIEHPWYDILVPLTGENGNIFHLMSVVRSHMKESGVPKAQINKFVSEVTSSNSYDSALHCIQCWVNVT